MCAYRARVCVRVCACVCVRVRACRERACRARVCRAPITEGIPLASITAAGGTPALRRRKPPSRPPRCEGLVSRRHRLRPLFVCTCTPNTPRSRPGVALRQ
eukprot:265635-Rhodomonas_salina.2